ncbi:MAG: hypothetical protein JO001_02490 [Alphaproteobacteria bacterium]|nr:hypothetical protein [Alphaproteobacteria bacterium]
MRSLYGAAVMLGVLVVSPLAAEAQAPYPAFPPPPPGMMPMQAPGAMAPAPASPEASEIAACLCLQQQIQVLRSQSTAVQGTYSGQQAELARLDAEMARERSRMDVNNPEAVARFRQLLEQRDALYRRSSGASASNAMASATRYNRAVDEYNARCTNRPRDPILLGRVQSTLSCPAMP